MSTSSSPSVTPSKRSRTPSLTLDTSCLPSLSYPSPPSNTLIITELNNLAIFQPSSLDVIKSQIGTVAPLNSFSPLPSFRRLLCSFMSEQAAIQVRQLLEQHAIRTDRGVPLQSKIYFGEPTPVVDPETARRNNLLEAPHIDKLFFISPPPSPPHGWQMRHEDPPNKEVHASDLAEALERLSAVDIERQKSPDSPVSPPGEAGSGSRTTTRARSGSSAVLYTPETTTPNVPWVMVEDTTMSSGRPNDDSMDLDTLPRKFYTNTARPPIESI